MLTSGAFLKQARIKKKFSKEKLGEIIKIRPDFIDFIENSLWDKLPERPVIVGFVKNIASTLEVNVEQAVALLRRDYPEKKLKVNPNPDLPKKFGWNPKLTFFVGISLTIFLVLGYLTFQYIGFIRSPKLIISDPQENQIIEKRLMVVSGITDPNSSLVVNNQPVIVNEDGSFKTEIEVTKDTKEIEAKSSSRSGKITKVVRKINVAIE